MLAAAVRPWLPDLVHQRNDKMGFTFPFDPWLRGPLAGRAREALAAVQALGWLRKGVTDRVWQDFLAVRVHWSRVWALTALASLIT